MLLAQPAPVAVWLDDADRPVRLVYEGARYTTIDIPTPLPGDVDWPTGITHPPARRSTRGWRLTARSTVTGEALVFDLRHTGAEWQVEQVYP
ncbi:hypothetical protein [Agromyces humatus]|uniref:Nucleotidyltransferase n=1 Tax=Agromyces humatus TaxID=279573 RepID=A0ABN2KG70_9MICO|nr:hypothetical protein [Agromyces humatus]